MNLTPYHEISINIYTDLFSKLSLREKLFFWPFYLFIVILQETHLFYYMNLLPNPCNKIHSVMSLQSL